MEHGLLGLSGRSEGAALHMDMQTKHCSQETYYGGGRGFGRGSRSAGAGPGDWNIKTHLVEQDRRMALLILEAHGAARRRPGSPRHRQQLADRALLAPLHDVTRGRCGRGRAGCRCRFALLAERRRDDLDGTLLLLLTRRLQGGLQGHGGLGGALLRLAGSEPLDALLRPGGLARPARAHHQKEARYRVDGLANDVAAHQPHRAEAACKGEREPDRQREAHVREHSDAPERLGEMKRRRVRGGGEYEEEAWEMQGDCMAVTYPPMDCWPDPESAPLETASSASKET